MVEAGVTISQKAFLEAAEKKYYSISFYLTEHGDKSNETWKKMAERAVEKVDRNGFLKALEFGAIPDQDILDKLPQEWVEERRIVMALLDLGGGGAGDAGPA